MSLLKEKQNLNLIQGLRGIASLLVVCYHASANSKDILQKEFLFGAFSSGYSGLDIFFVLSGFIITYTTSKNYKQSGQLLLFIRRRFVRIFPTYWIIISLFLLAQLLMPQFYKTLFSFDFVNLVSTFFLFPGHVMVNGVSWTLSYELFYYAIFLLVFILPNKNWAYAIFAIFTIFLLLFTHLGYYRSSEGLVRFFLNPMNMEFFLGVFSATLVKRISRGVAFTFLISGTLIYIIATFLINTGSIIHDDLNRIPLFGVPAFLFITGLVYVDLNYKVKIAATLIMIGEASYSFYLLHLPIIAAFIKIYPKLNIESNVAYNIILVGLILLLGLVSILFFKFIEKPVIDRLNNKPVRSTPAYNS